MEEFEKDQQNYEHTIEELKKNAESLSRSSSDSKLMNDGFFKELVLNKINLINYLCRKKKLKIWKMKRLAYLNQQRQIRKILILF